MHLAQDWRYSKSLESLLEVLLNLRSFFLIKEAESIYAMFLRFWNVTLRNYNSYKSWAKSLPYTECTSDKWRSYWPNKMLQIDIPFVEQPVISLILLTVIITSWIYGSHKEKLVNHMKMSACSLWYEQAEDFFWGWRLLICCLPAVVFDGTLWRLGNGAFSVPLTVLFVNLKIDSCSLVTLDLWSHFFLKIVERLADRTVWHNKLSGLD